MGWDSDSEESADEVEDQQYSTNTITYVLIVIDTDDLMFQKDENSDECTFKTVLRSCYHIMDYHLMKGGKRGICPIAIAVVSDDFDKTTICEFKDNLPSTLKKLRELCEFTDADLESKFKRKNAIQLSSFLLQCKSKVNAVGQDYSKCIAYITKNDNPVGDDENEKRLCVNQAKSFKDFQIFVELLTFNPLFNYDTFFKEILEAASCKFKYEYFSTLMELNEKLFNLMTFRGSRALFFPFPGRNNFVEVVEKVYIKPHKILNNVIVTRDTHAEVKEIKRGGEFKDTYRVDIKHSNTHISLTENETTAILHDDIPIGFTLLGTYEGEMVETGLHSTDPKFIQRNKRKNNPHFDIFWQYCVDKNRKLICARKYRRGGPTKIVQLTPKLINNIRSFLVLGIPYFDDIKYQDFHNPLYEEKPTDDKEIMEAAENLVKAVTFEYDITKIHDTVNCRKWEYIRSELLEEKLRPVPDILNLKLVENDVSDVVKVYQYATPVTGVKRKLPAKSRASKKK